MGPSRVYRWISLSAVGLLMAASYGFAGGSRAGGHDARVAPMPIATPAAVPSIQSVGLDKSGPVTTVTITGDRFDDGSTVTLRGTYAVLTFGPSAVAHPTSRSLAIGAEAIGDGVYVVSVLSRGGRLSNGVPLTVKGSKE